MRFQDPDGFLLLILTIVPFFQRYEVLRSCRIHSIHRSAAIKGYVGSRAQVFIPEKHGSHPRACMKFLPELGGTRHVQNKVLR